MLVLRSFVQDGVVPLLGPPTSIGDVHHGAWYYYLLSPAAFLTGGDSPLAVVLEIALAGIAAVLVTWWLARSIGGPVAGLVAGLTMAMSISAIDESTFIWNPNLIALSSAIALAGAWRAWSTGRSGWWLVAGVGTAITMQCHVLGVTLLPIVAALWVADLRRGASVAGSGSRHTLAFGLGGLAIVALSFAPLAIHELTADFSELAAALDYIRSGGDPSGNGPLVRFVVILARVVSWPLTGLITDGPVAALVAATGVLVAIVVGWVLGTAPERIASRWLGLGLVWTAFALTFLSPSLATVVVGLPNDHYHAFADPMVFVLVGIGASVVWRSRSQIDRRGAARVVGPVVAAAAVGTLLAWNLVHQPPAVNADGGFPAAADAATRILGVAEGDSITLRSIPDFKSTEAYGYPLIRDGANVVVDMGSDSVLATTGSVVVICDSLFEVAVGAACNGPAEAIVAPSIRFGEPVLRFEAAPGRFISVYGPAE
jgi:Dolichyl-phosphate-mannose-protein mannosyltransferase